uniref:Uncharacterized protein n=1 Tax=Panagrolaimus sp. PS1159 TaxID=55785 RepID=A0AC35GL98_9BILA
MVGILRFFTFAALIFGVIQNSYCASVKGYNPYGIKKTTTTPTLATTTAVPKEMIRHCICSESEECINDVWLKNLTTCQEQCKSKLNFFGNNTDYNLKCIKNDPNDATLINSCFKIIPGYCAKTNDSQIEKPSYELKEDNMPKVKQIELVEAFKSFHVCAGECMKEIIVECFEKKGCGVSLGASRNIGRLGEFCHSLKSSVITSSAKALPCLMPPKKPRRKIHKKQ